MFLFFTWMLLIPISCLKVEKRSELICLAFVKSSIECHILHPQPCFQISFKTLNSHVSFLHVAGLVLVPMNKWWSSARAGRCQVERWHKPKYKREEGYSNLLSFQQCDFFFYFFFPFHPFAASEAWGFSKSSLCHNCGGMGSSESWGNSISFQSQHSLLSSLACQ